MIRNESEDCGGVGEDPMMHIEMRVHSKGRCTHACIIEHLTSVHVSRTALIGLMKEKYHYDGHFHHLPTSVIPKNDQLSIIILRMIDLCK